MLLKQRSNGHLVEVENVHHLFNVFHEEIVGRDQVGEEVQDPEPFKKSDLIFLSGEELPRCWTDSHYRDEVLNH
jgi:hypothetical protein